MAMLDLHLTICNLIFCKEVPTIHMLLRSLAAGFAPIDQQVTRASIVLKHFCFVNSVSVALHCNKIVVPQDLGTGTGVIDD